jgi:hypothetical protein
MKALNKPQITPTAHNPVDHHSAVNHSANQDAKTEATA